MSELLSPLGVEFRKTPLTPEVVAKKMDRESKSLAKKIREASIELPDSVRQIVERCNVASVKMQNKIGIKDARTVTPDQFFFVRTSAMPKLTKMSEQHLRKVAGVAFSGQRKVIIPIEVYDQGAVKEQEYSEDEIQDAIADDAFALEEHLVNGIIDELELDFGKVNSLRDFDIDNVIGSFLFSNRSSSTLKESYAFNDALEIFGGNEEELIDEGDYLALPEQKKREIRKEVRGMLKRTKERVDNYKFKSYFSDIEDEDSEHRSTLYHEAVHLMGHSKIVATKEEVLFRSGFSTPGREEDVSLFECLNEACVESVSHELLDDQEGSIESFNAPGSYSMERKLLKHIITRVADNEQKTFSEVWTLWKRSYFDGNLMNLRSIEAAFGKGTLRVYAELPLLSYASKNELQKYQKLLFEKFEFVLELKKMSEHQVGDA